MRIRAAFLSAKFSLESFGKQLLHFIEMAPRFYVDSDFQSGGTLVLPEKPAHHASRVLRMREGDAAVLFDGKGLEAQAVMHFFADRTEAEIIAVQKSQTESPLQTTLIQSLVSQEKLDWILEKSTELGVSKIVIVPAARSVTKLDEKRLEKRLAQWKNTVLSACEQCGRSVLPEVIYCSKLENALKEHKSELNFVLAPAAQNRLPQEKSTSITFAVGPEGGFSEEEIALANEIDYKSALLGPRVLRTETAGIVVLTAAQCIMGDLL